MRRCRHRGASVCVSQGDGSGKAVMGGADDQHIGSGDSVHDYHTFQ